MIDAQNYFDTARKNENAFRAILTRIKAPIENLNLEEIFEKYSKGDREGIFTIIDFVEKGDNKFEFTWGDFAPFSGLGRTELWIYADGEANIIEVISTRMS
ncbi:MAG: hypothetical protein DI539_21405 [Flavobacterium psychrophilum]|nr:MAG: hypothetical protein DI539_21405 [Flavobacterium psychrophilum]